MERDAKRFIYPSGDGFYSGLEVCQSGAGFYIGRMHWNLDMGGFIEPGSRETDYYAKREDAEQALREGSFEVRENAETQHLYDSGTVPRPKAPASELQRALEKQLNAEFDKFAAAHPQLTREQAGELLVQGASTDGGAIVAENIPTTAIPSYALRVGSGTQDGSPFVALEVAVTGPNGPSKPLPVYFSEPEQLVWVIDNLLDKARQTWPGVFRDGSVKEVH